MFIGFVLFNELVGSAFLSYVYVYVCMCIFVYLYICT